MKVYLGDAVYARIEDGMIKLETEGLFGNIENVIYLEPEVYKNLTLFFNKKF